MNKYGSIIAASIITVFTACGLFARITFQKQHFDRTVSEALKTSEGYDQRFIDMVNRLESELALRASFGYIGRKDPMTGKERIVVSRQPEKKLKIRPAANNNTITSVTPPSDSVRLTAIIYDDVKKLYTAIIMVGERSYAIEAGDYVIGRRVSTINDSLIVMNNGFKSYIYDIAGNFETR